MREATCYTAPQKSAPGSSGSPNLSSYFSNVTNQKCSSVFIASNLEISLNNPAPNDMWKVSTLAIDLRGINYDYPFVLTVSPLVIDTRVCDLRVPTHGTMAVSTTAVDSNIPDLNMFRNLEEEGQNIKAKLTGQNCIGLKGWFLVTLDTQILIWEQFRFRAREVKISSSISEQGKARHILQNVGVLNEKENIDADINGHHHFNNKTMTKVAVIKSWSLVTYSRLSPTKMIDPYAIICGISSIAEKFQHIFMPIVFSETQTVFKDIVYQDLEAQARQKRGSSFPSLSGEVVDAAVAASTSVEPHGKCSIVFALGWATPRAIFVKGNTSYRRCTKFYGTYEDAATKLVHDTLMNYQSWETTIENWQGPIIKNENLPEWYRFTLFNELDYLLAGGTIWTDGVPLV
eukprot:Gb_02041 [translate_table: standard]